MNALFRLIDVDYVQWKAVSRTLLRTDFRLPLVEGSSGLGRIANLLSMVVFLSLYGLGAAVLVIAGSDVLLTTTIVLAYCGVMLTTSLLTHHGMTLLSGTDYVVLGPRPVSSRTFLAIRVTNVLFHAAVITALMGAPVVTAYALAHGASASRGVAGALAIAAWSLTVTLAIVASYGALLRHVGRNRLTRALGYMQLAAGFLAYGGLLVSGRALGGTGIATATMPDAWWVLLLPPAWFASYLEFATGSANSTTVARIAISILVMLALGAALRGKLGLDYARRLADLPQSDGSTAQAVRTPLFRSGEARAAAILVVAHFKHDLRVRLGVLGVVPLIAINLLIDLDGPFDLVAFSVLLFPGVLTQHFATSDAHAAAWIYAATPANLPRLIASVKNVAVVYFVVPFLAVVVAVYVWRTGDIRHALVHTAMLGLLSHMALQGAGIIAPRLPFALPPSKTRGEAALMAWMMFVIFGGQAALFTLDRYVYVSATRVAAAFLTLLAMTWALSRLMAWRTRRYSQPTR